MCNLGIQRNFSQQMISRNLSEAQLALKKKNDARAFAILKALAASQISPSPDLSLYPVLKAALNERSRNS